MTISDHVTEFAGLPVVDVDASAPNQDRADPDTADPDRVDPDKDDPAAVAWRVSGDWDGSTEDFARFFETFLATVDASAIRALIIGEWGSSYETTAPIDLVVAAAPRLPALRALFLGEMTYEQCEISWIKQGDVTPLLEAYPELEVLRVRGADGLELSPVRHAALRELVFESGGLPGAVVRAVGECDLPALTTLELWLGTDEYGGDATVDDLAPILAGTRLPALRHLGLRDSEIADQVAAALAGAAVVARLETLDLSLGALGDVGAVSLLGGQPLIHLRRLDLHHHFLSAQIRDRLVDELGAAGVEVDVSDEQDAEEDDGRRYIAVAE
jgi:hypothetical protein